MKLLHREFLHLAAGAAALPAVSRFAWAQAYPARPITIIVPFPKRRRYARSPGAGMSWPGRFIGGGTSFELRRRDSPKWW